MSTSGHGEQQYSLRWNDYHTSILSSFRHLRDEEDFVDVTLACDGCSFTAHKVVLSACSPYFRRLLKANPCQHPIVILRDVKQRDMESLLRFMYNGEVHIGQEQLEDFIKTAQTLQVRGLADMSSKESHRLSASSEHRAWGQHLDSSGHRDDGLVTPPPTKRSRAERYSDSPALNSQSDHHRDSLLGQALEGGHQHHLNAQLQSGDDSSTNDSASDKLEGNNNIGRSRHGNGRSDRDDMVPKSEPSDYGEDLGEGMDHSGRNPYPAALLGLQGLAGLLPGPSGIHNSNQDSNFGPMMLGGELSRDPSSLPSSSSGAASTSDVVSGVSPQCPFCGREYSSRGNLRQHINNVHYQPQQWASCDMCGKNFKTKHYLQNHKLYAHGLRQRANQTTTQIPPNIAVAAATAAGSGAHHQTTEGENKTRFRLDQELGSRYFPLRPPFIPQLGEQRRDTVTFIPQLPQLADSRRENSGGGGMFSQTEHRREGDITRPIQAVSVPPHLSLTIPQAPKLSHIPLIQQQQQQPQQLQQTQQQHTNNKPEADRSQIPSAHAFHQPFH